MEHFEEISQKSQMHRLELIFHKKFHEGVFKFLLINCTMNRNACKESCLIGAFIQHLTQFWSGFLGLFLGTGCKIAHPLFAFATYMLQPQKVANI